MSYIVIKYFHFLAILFLTSALVVEHLLVRVTITRGDLRRLRILDAVYGISAVIVLLTGLGLVFLVGKPASFYTVNPYFHLKLTLFLLIVLTSIYPTLQLMRLSRGVATETVNLPKPVVNVIRAEMVAFLPLPLLAVLIATGYGLPA